MREAIETKREIKGSKVLAEGGIVMAKDTRITIENQKEYDELYAQLVPAVMTSKEFGQKFRLKGQAGGSKSAVMSAYKKEWEKLEAQVDNMNANLIKDDVRDTDGDNLICRVMFSKHSNATRKEKEAYNRVLENHSKK